MHQIDTGRLQTFFIKDLNKKQDLFDSLIQVFENQLKDLKNHPPVSENYEILKQLAHKVKSGARSFGASTLVTKLERMEELLSDENNNSEDLNNLYGELLSDFEKSLVEIKNEIPALGNL